MKFALALISASALGTDIVSQLASETVSARTGSNSNNRYCSNGLTIHGAEGLIRTDASGL